MPPSVDAVDSGVVPGPLPGHLARSKRAWLLPFVIAGVACIIAGGLLAAATAYVTTQKTAWATAYIVLVGGIAQIGLGAGVAWLSPAATARLAWWAFAGWNLGNAGVLTGQLTGVVAVTDIGTALLVISLVLVLIAVRHRLSAAGQSPPTPPRAPADPAGPGRPPAPDVSLHPPRRAVLWTFRGLIVVLAITMPIGVVLAHVGH